MLFWWLVVLVTLFICLGCVFVCLCLVCYVTVDSYECIFLPHRPREQCRGEQQRSSLMCLKTLKPLIKWAALFMAFFLTSFIHKVPSDFDVMPVLTAPQSKGGRELIHHHLVFEQSNKFEFSFFHKSIMATFNLLSASELPLTHNTVWRRLYQHKIAPVERVCVRACMS